MIPMQPIGCYNDDYPVTLLSHPSVTAQTRATKEIDRTCHAVTCHVNLKIGYRSRDRDIQPATAGHRGGGNLVLLTKPPFLSRNPFENSPNE